ncbi:MAG: hypothetical protein Q9214_007320 [Letrouitia sp. 1 TL-2023]
MALRGARWDIISVTEGSDGFMAVALRDDPSMHAISLTFLSLLFHCLPFSLPHPLTPRAGDSDTQLDIVSGVCKNVTLLYARGTGDGGNFGGPGRPGIDFANTLYARLGESNVALQGVEREYYPARYRDNWSNIPEDSKIAGARMADLAGQLFDSCRTSKLVLSGYSQGVMVTHEAANKISTNSALDGWISSVVVFGDPSVGLPGGPPVEPPFGDFPASKVKSICNTGDKWCDKDYPNDEAAHTNYGPSSDAAADFAIAAFGGSSTSGESGTQPSTSAVQPGPSLVLPGPGLVPCRWGSGFGSDFGGDFGGDCFAQKQ